MTGSPSLVRDDQLRELGVVPSRRRSARLFRCRRIPPVAVLPVPSLLYDLI